MLSNTIDADGEWVAALAEGVPGDLARLADMVATPEVSLTPHSATGLWYDLRSSRFEGLTDGRAVADEAQAIVDELEAAAFHASNELFPLEVRQVRRVYPSGREDVFALAQTASGSARAYNAGTAMRPNETSTERLLRLQRLHPRLMLALRYAKDRGWFSLWKTYENIRDGVGGQRALDRRAWVPASELRRFRQTANSHEALGDHARHADLTIPSPARPMTASQAHDIMRTLLQGWIEEIDPA